MTRRQRRAIRQRRQLYKRLYRMYRKREELAHIGLCTMINYYTKGRRYRMEDLPELLAQRPKTFYRPSASYWWSPLYSLSRLRRMVALKHAIELCDKKFYYNNAIL